MATAPHCETLQSDAAKPDHEYAGYRIARPDAGPANSLLPWIFGAGVLATPPRVTAELNAFLTLFLGALLGLVSSLLLTRWRHGQAITLKILDRWLEMRHIVAQQLTDLAMRSLSYEIDPANTAQDRRAIQILFYQYYYLLLRIVLDLLICLDVSLKDEQARLYCVAKRRIRPIDSRTLEQILTDEYYLNTSLWKRQELAAADQRIRFNAVIYLQASRVLRELDRALSVSALRRVGAAYTRRHG